MEIQLYQRQGLPPQQGGNAKMPYQLADNSGMIKFGGAVEGFAGGLMGKIVASQIATDKDNVGIALLNKRNAADKWLADNPDKAIGEAQTLDNFNTMFSEADKKSIVDSAQTPDGKRAAASMYDQHKAQYLNQYQTRAMAQSVQNQEVSLKANITALQNIGESATNWRDRVDALNQISTIRDTAATHKIGYMQDPVVKENANRADAVKILSEGIIVDASAEAAKNDYDEASAGKVIDDHLKKLSEGELWQGHKITLTQDEKDHLDKTVKSTIYTAKVLSEQNFFTKLGDTTKSVSKVMFVNQPDGSFSSDTGAARRIINGINLDDYPKSQQDRVLDYKFEWNSRLDAMEQATAKANAKEIKDIVPDYEKIVGLDQRIARVKNGAVDPMLEGDLVNARVLGVFGDPRSKASGEMYREMSDKMINNEGTFSNKAITHTLSAIKADDKKNIIETPGTLRTQLNAQLKAIGTFHDFKQATGIQSYSAYKQKQADINKQLANIGDDADNSYKFYMQVNDATEKYVADNPTATPVQIRTFHDETLATLRGQPAGNVQSDTTQKVSPKNFTKILKNPKTGKLVGWDGSKWQPLD